MQKILAGLFILSPMFLSAQEVTPQVGKHVGANMDAMSMILSLLMVLALIIASAFLLKRFQPARMGQKGLKVITSLHLGAKERVMVVQVADKQLLLGVTAQQITVLDTLDEPLEEHAPLSADLPQSIISLFKNNDVKANEKK